MFRLFKNKQTEPLRSNYDGTLGAHYTIDIHAYPEWLRIGDVSILKSRVEGVQYVSGLGKDGHHGEIRIITLSGAEYYFYVPFGHEARKISDYIFDQINKKEDYEQTKTTNR